MQVIELTAPGFTNLRPATHPDPRPGPNEVLVRLRAASLNYLDLMVARGDFPGVSYPLVPVTDGAGEIVETGTGVTGWTPGDRVIAHFLSNWTMGPLAPQSVSAMRGVSTQGSLAHYVVVPAASLVATPAHLTDAQAATLPIAATTAWNALSAGDIRPGKTVLLLGTGGVSIFALQLAKAAGAKVIITSSSNDKLVQAKELGADFGINYRATPEWDAEVLKLTGGHGADLVIESGGKETFNRSLNAAAYCGTVFLIGMVTGAELQVNVMSILGKALRVQGNNTGSVQHLSEVARAIEVNRITPVIDRLFDWREARKAYETLEQASHVGKLALTITD